MLKNIFPSELLSKIGRSEHCSEEQRNLIKKLIGEGKTYKEVKEIIGCSAKIILNTVNGDKNPETRGKNEQLLLKRIGVRMAKIQPIITSRKMIKNFL